MSLHGAVPADNGISKDHITRGISKDTLRTASASKTDTMSIIALNVTASRSAGAARVHAHISDASLLEVAKDVATLFVRISASGALSGHE